MKEVPIACNTCGAVTAVATDFEDFIEKLQAYGITGDIQIDCLNCANQRFKIETRNRSFRSYGRKPVRSPR